MDSKTCVYILKCRDDSLYTGWTTDIENRIKIHNQGDGGKYTRSRIPVRLVYLEYLPNKSEALKRELAIKKLPRTEKEKLIKSDLNEL